MKYKFRIYDVNTESYMEHGLSGNVPIWKSGLGGITLDIALAAGVTSFIVEMMVPNKFDSTDQKIFEGDIIEIERYGRFSGSMYLVKWICQPTGHSLGLVDQSGFSLSIWPAKIDMTVAGNINQNPELFNE